MTSFISKPNSPPSYDFSKELDSKMSSDAQEEKEFKARKLMHNLIGLFVIFILSTSLIWYLSKNVDENGLSSYCFDQLKTNVKKYKEVSIELFFIFIEIVFR